MLFVHHVSTGTFLHKFPLKYPKFKDVLELVPLPDKPHQVAVIDPEKGNIIDIRNKKFITAFQNWGGKSWAIAHANTKILIIFIIPSCA